MIGPISAAGAIFVALAIATTPAAAATVDVRLKDHAFSPATISAKPGDTIVFHDDDPDLHSLWLPRNEALLATHFIEPHTSYGVVIPATADPATYELVCTIHIDMKGTLRITAK
jgi:plastocyanin